ncbi:MAG TPA: hypothetical protein VNI58_01835 [Mariprofundaceae bacterium]|nr:hypothetical protein [Mariprofundaceae bacterium]
MGSDTFILILGGLLVLTSVLGGGFEVKEVKIPKIGGWARMLAGIIGTILIVLGIGMSTSSTNNNTNPAPPSVQGSSTFWLSDNLGQGQVSEQVRVLIDGKEVGTLTVNEQYPNSKIRITVPNIGRHNYDLEARAVFRDENGQLQEIFGVGQGSIIVSDGKKFELASTITGNDTWIAHMEEVSQ